MHIITDLPTSKLFWYGKLIFSKKIGSWTVPESSVAVVVKCSAIRGGDGKVLRQRGGDSGKLLPAVRGLIKKLVDAEVLHTSWGVPPPHLRRLYLLLLGWKKAVNCTWPFRLDAMIQSDGKYVQVEMHARIHLRNRRFNEQCACVPTFLVRSLEKDQFMINPTFCRQIRQHRIINNPIYNKLKTKY